MSKSCSDLHCWSTKKSTMAKGKAREYANFMSML